MRLGIEDCYGQRPNQIGWTKNNVLRLRVHYRKSARLWMSRLSASSERGQEIAQLIQHSEIET